MGRDRDDGLRTPASGQEAMMEALQPGARFFRLVCSLFVARNIRYEEDLVDQLFNSSEKDCSGSSPACALGKRALQKPLSPRSVRKLCRDVGTTVRG